MTGNTTFYDKKANFIFNGEDKKYENAFINEVYEVSGRILDKETHSYLIFEYEFDTLEEANDYCDKMKRIYPLSIINIYKNTWQQYRFCG